ncbi:hypothetical protein HYPSUDRAFT_209738 [Hypholoma sublateritium FD-334 SS-4]|uniref:Uncharacterized protein n=1 Tax=Hypholoma sublateritium (strain FD-334 SS-4) TaxID=945553 RepID=A0A0D2N1Z5_HYPSF|nr:hypothetical protein HYPSUDRAFT_209738 [Hypholoma sublateritium FD-334 SS-4]
MLDTAGAHPATEAAPAGAAANQPVFEDETGSTTHIPLDGGHQMLHDSVRVRVYVAADGGPPIIVRDSTSTVTTVTREIFRETIAGDTGSEDDDAMDVSSPSDDPLENPLGALAAAWAAAHPAERVAPSARGAPSASAGPTGASAAGPSRGRRMTRSAAATHVRRWTFIGPRRQTIYVRSSGSENEAANAAIAAAEDNATIEDGNADTASGNGAANAATEDDDVDQGDEAAVVGKGKGKARA